MQLWFKALSTKPKFNLFMPLFEDMLYMYFLHTTEICNALSQSKHKAKT